MLDKNQIHLSTFDYTDLIHNGGLVGTYVGGWFGLLSIVQEEAYSLIE